MIIMIAAVADNNALGKNNDLLWHLPNDFKRFKAITSGHYIIMGRKTFESFPKPLPNRTHVIISRQKEYKVAGCVVVSSLEEALSVSPANEDVFIIGGGEIYNLALPIANKLDLTKVHHTFKADAYFPEIDPKQWKLTNSEHHSKDEKHEYDYSFESYERIE